MKHTQSEWELMIGAYLYEVHANEPDILSDQGYDRISNHLKEVGTTIPGFDASTGQWVLEFIKNEEYHSILKEAKLRLMKYSPRTEGTSPIHLIDQEYLK